METIKAEFPQFHTTAMREALFGKFGQVCLCSNPQIATRRNLTGINSSASHDYQETEIDEHVSEIY